MAIEHAIPKCTSMNDTALLVEFDAVISPQVNRRVRRLMAGLTRREMDGTIEIVPAYRSLLIHYNPCKITTAQLHRQVERVAEDLDRVIMPRSRKFYLPVCYDDIMGLDLSYVAEYHKLTKDEVIAIHTSRDYLVYTIGFLAGMPYLGELPEQIATPRLAKPRTRIPVGSVAIAGNQTGIYPLESPGGWRIIGRTPIDIYTPQQDPPTLLSSGDYVRFVPIPLEQFEKIKGEVQADNYQIRTEEVTDGD